MSISRPWTLDLDAVPHRPVHRAGVLLAWGQRWFLLDDDGFAAAPAQLPPHGEVDIPLALSPDGTRLLLSSVENGGMMLLVDQVLATGRRRRISAPAGRFDFKAAFAPDGQTLAVLTQDDDMVAIEVIDHVGGRRRLWAAYGGASEQETAIAWSTDGTMIAATYLDAEADAVSTVIVDAGNGATVAGYPGRAVVGCPNGTWVDNRRLVLVDDLADEAPPPLYLIDPTGGGRRIARPEWWRYPVACLGGRVLVLDREGGLLLTDLHGDQSELFASLPADLGIATFDIAPAVLRP